MVMRVGGAETLRADERLKVPRSLPFSEPCRALSARVLRGPDETTSTVYATTASRRLVRAPGQVDHRVRQGAKDQRHPTLHRKPGGDPRNAQTPHLESPHGCGAAANSRADVLYDPIQVGRQRH